MPTRPQYTTEEWKLIGKVKALQEELGRRPRGRDLYRARIQLAGKGPLGTLLGILEAAGVIHTTPDNPLGFTEEEDQTFTRMYQEGIRAQAIDQEMGLAAGSAGAEITRRGWRRNRALAVSVPDRRCESCYQVTRGFGPCQHCAAPWANATREAA